LQKQLFAGNVIRFVNDRHATAHQISEVQDGGRTVVVKLADDLQVGLVRIDGVEPTALTTSTAVPLFPAYRGTTVCDELFRFFHPVQQVVEGKITLAKPLPAEHPFKVGEKAWLLDVGPGDIVE